MRVNRNSPQPADSVVRTPSLVDKVKVMPAVYHHLLGEFPCIAWPQAPKQSTVMSPLVAAARAGNARDVKRILDEALMKPDEAKALMAEGRLWNGALEVAAEKGHVPVIEVLLEYWTRHPTLRNRIIKHPGEALGRAAKKGQVEAVRAILNKVKEVPELKTFMHKGYTAMEEAVEGRKHEVVSLLIDFAEQNPELADLALGRADLALMEAVLAYDDEMVRIMMNSQYYERFVGNQTNRHPSIKEKVDNAVAPYLVDL